MCLAYEDGVCSREIQVKLFGLSAVDDLRYFGNIASGIGMGLTHVGSNGKLDSVEGPFPSSLLLCHLLGRKLLVANLV